ncbi:putative HTH-type transcriptional regulator YdfH [Posidoniimonas polymericola]|uniref:Putative HTH-type transcriptional regulator YdfH n=1 Tax=Posidoniimonas polymericola TaxID=2528002 RepID=A0A5C5XUK7_9BACT|nr:GntR family transcriptional regulator [Posidoniimonas polymericola]TWT66937.1 putative HTH-type transcriptional regulator YdfH [Posidoniimonas polymericola]
MSTSLPERVSPAWIARKSQAGGGMTLTQRVYQTIHDEIVSGALGPGERLVRRTLSKRLGVSPAPITETLLRLESEGLVEFAALHGSRVRPLQIQDVKNDQMLREAIECQAARLCAEFATGEDLAKLLVDAKPLDRIIARGDRRSQVGLQAHLEFHVHLAQYGGYAGLADELERVWFRQVMRLNWLGETWHRDVPEDWHQQLVKVLMSRDPDKAEAKMRDHVRFAKDTEREQFHAFLRGS